MCSETKSRRMTGRKRMWKIGLAMVVAGIMVLGYGGICSKKSSHTSSGSSSQTGNYITIKGTFGGGTHASNNWWDWIDRIISSPLYALDPSQVSKVIVFSPEGCWSISNVADDGSFSIDAERDNPVGLVFAGSSNNYLGYLTLENGIDSLPLIAITDTSVTAIDLQVLSSSGLIVEPGYNPLENELNLSAEEQTAIAQSDDFFASVIKNMDVDGDGTIDLLQDKFYRPFIGYFIIGGSFGVNLTPSVITPASISGFKFSFGVWDEDAISFPSIVSFTGPAGSTLSDTPNDQTPCTFENGASYGSPLVENPTIPPGGTYTVTYTDSTLTFDIPAQTSAVSNTVLAIPTVTLDGDNIKKVNWVYKLGNGVDDATLDPRTIIQWVQLQINGTGTPHDTYPGGGDRLYNSNSGNPSPPTVTEDVLPTTSASGEPWSINWSDVTGIGTTYTDIYGNHYAVGWNK